jgi:hypothetical protein
VEIYILLPTAFEVEVHWFKGKAKEEESVKRAEKELPELRSLEEACCGSKEFFKKGGSSWQC